MSLRGVFFAILIHDDYEQRNGIESEAFTPAMCWENYSILKDLVDIKFIEDPQFQLKNREN